MSFHYKVKTRSTLNDYCAKIGGKKVEFLKGITLIRINENQHFDITIIQV